MIARVALRNALHDPRRFAASVAGVCFSVVLVLVQLGLFVGLARNSSQIVDRSPGDVWVVGRNTGNFQWGQPFPRRALYAVRTTTGVAWARELVVGWTQLRHPDGGMQQLEVVGFDVPSRVGAPWHVVAGDLDMLSIPGRIALDRSAAEKVGAFELGDDREMQGRRVRVAAVTEGITSFTTVPFVFASLDTARSLAAYIGPDDTVYVVAGLAPGADLSAVVAALRARLPHLDVFDRASFSWHTRRYWMLETGMGIGFLLTSLLAIAVGTVIVSQAVYAATAEHLPEYGTLKAMGMGNAGLGTVVLWQAILAALAGGIPGCLIGTLAVRVIQAHGLEAALTPALIVLTAAAAVVASVVAALTSVARVRRLDAALVFRA
jgi:putative ABC transport system permease protein